jgi:hypothetical protein
VPFRKPHRVSSKARPLQIRALEALLTEHKKGDPGGPP